jgi:hypothetical protein
MRGSWRPVLTPRWLLVHAAAVVAVLAMSGLCYWQVTRAADGNLLSFGYAIEWPAFAAFVGYVWWKEVRRALAAAHPAGPDTIAPPVIEPVRRRQRVGAAYDDSGDEELAAYNRYLTWLNQNPHASPSDYPG